MIQIKKIKVLFNKKKSTTKAKKKRDYYYTIIYVKEKMPFIKYKTL